MQRLKHGSTLKPMQENSNFGHEIEISLEEFWRKPSYYGYLLIHHKVLHFRELNPTIEQHENILRELFRGKYNSKKDIPGEILNINHEEMLASQIHCASRRFVSDGKGNRIFRSDNHLENWHSDWPSHTEPPSLTSMHMHTFDVEKGKGGTYFADMQHAYEVCPPEIKQYLDGEWNRNVPPPLLHGTGTHPGGIWGEHPALRTHPVSGKTSIFYSGVKTKAVHTDSDSHQQEAWFQMRLFGEFMEWMLTYLEDNHYGYEWTEGDLTVWDNRNVVHAFPTKGWTPEQRVFNKIEYQYEKPVHHSNRQSL